MAIISCPACGQRFDAPLAGRKTNHGFRNAQNLVYFINASTPYRAESEPRSTKRRGSGVGMRPDIKLTLKDATASKQCVIFVERQEQNTSGTGSEKIANKIHKALQALRDRAVDRYFIVLAGRRLQDLERVATDTFDNGGAYRHERLEIVTEDAFKQRAERGLLQ